MKLSLITGLLLLAGSSLLFEGGESAKILTISFMSSISHKITYEPLLRELAKRGHEITVYSPIRSENGTNFKNFDMVDLETMFSDEKGGKKKMNFFEMKKNMPAVVEALFNPYLFLGNMFKDLCTKSYELPQVKELLNQKFDLIFFTPFFNDCLWGLIHKMNTTTVVYQQMAVMPWISDMMGSPSPPSFVSSLLIGYPDRMNFLQRFWNFIKTGLDWAALELYYIPKMQGVYREAYKDPSMPSIAEIAKAKTSIVLANSHISFNEPRPFMPDIIEVGGLHLKPGKAVEPKELDDFLSGGKDGFILFSMGSALKGSQMPEEYRKLFLNVFSKLKQRVIWKWETEEMEGLPPNVKLSKWLPQQDVLGHKNIRLFITHGGMGSTAESIYHGVPLVGIPILGDQPSNMMKAAKYGFALPPLDFSTLTEEILLEAINKALNDPSYRDSAKRLSKIYLDQPNKPMDRAVYWVEYVLRHKGAPHLRSAARDLNYIQYFSLDVLALLAVLGLISLKINILIVKAIWRKCCGTKSEVNAKKKTN